MRRQGAEFGMEKRHDFAGFIQRAGHRLEARRLGRGQIRSERAERRFKADGVVTPRERFRLQRRQNRQSRRIFRFRRN